MPQNTNNQEEINQKKIRLSDIFTGTSHGFDPGIARFFGDANPAIVFSHLLFWIRHNKHLGLNFIEGKTWVYQTHAQISAYFGYLSDKQVRLALDKLVDTGFLITGHHSTNKFDRVLWYALANEEEEDKISKNLFETPKKANASDFSGTSDLPKKANVIYKDIIKDTASSSSSIEKKEKEAAAAAVSSDAFEAMVEYCQEKNIPVTAGELHALVKEFSGLEVQSSLNSFRKEWDKKSDSEKKAIKMPWRILKSKIKLEREYLASKKGKSK